MVVGRPTSELDIRNVRQHRWSLTEPVCLDCGLHIDDEEPWLMYTVACPGPDFIYIGHIKEELCTAKHCAEHAKE